ncbi:pyocin knob domain-containing protein [Acinetobacter baumannii]
MAIDTNINRIKFLRTTRAGAAPDPSLLDEGELAFNLVDRTIFSKNGPNIVELGFGKGGTVNGTINATGAITAPQFNGALNGVAANAIKLLTPRKINGVAFDGTSDITIEDDTKLYKNNRLGPQSAILRDVASYRQTIPQVKGALVLHFPASNYSSTTMMSLRILGYNYNPAATSWEILLSGYNYSGGTWRGTTATSVGGSCPFNEVTFASTAAADHNVIIFGNENTQWNYPNVDLVEMMIGHSNMSGWEGSYFELEDKAKIDSYVNKVNNTVRGVEYAKKWETATTLNFTGDTTGSVSFDGSETYKNVTLTTQRASAQVPGISKVINDLVTGGSVESLSAEMGKKLQNEKVAKSGDTMTGMLYTNGGITTQRISGSTTTPISILGPTVNGSNAGGIRVRTLEVAKRYGAAATSPRQFGIFSQSGVVAGPATSYTDLGAAGLGGDTAPFGISHSNIGSNYGFIPFLGGSIQSVSGYRQSVHIGAYRPQYSWVDSGVYIATGGNDQWATEAFIFKSGGRIESTLGSVSIQGNIDTATRLQTPRAINGTNFDGTAAITTAIWGLNRNITIGNKTQLVNGSTNYRYTLAEIGAVNRAGDTITGNLSVGGTVSAVGELISTKKAGEAKNVDYSRLRITPPTHTGGEWLHVVKDTNLNAYYDIGYGGKTAITLVNTGEVYTSELLDVGNYLKVNGKTTIPKYTKRTASILVNDSIYSPTGYVVEENRAIKPNGVAPGTTNTYFTSKAGLTGAADTTYGDFVVLNSWDDASGGNLNGLFFHKQAKRISHYQGSFNGGVWGPEHQLAYTSDNVASATKLLNARTINGVAFDGTANINIQQQAIKIPGGRNLNDYRGEGFYFCDTDAETANTANTPVNVSYSLIITKTAGINQTFIAYNGGGNDVWVRGFYNGTWSNWKKLAYVHDNVASATKLQTARSIGGVAFDGTANINLPGVNIQGNQNTTGNAASATRLQTARTFQITGGITTNAVSFDGQQNVTLTASNVDGSKVSGAVPEAVKAQTVMVNGQPGARLAAMWSGTTWNKNFTRDAVYSSASSITIEIGDSGDQATDDRMNNIKVGSLLHLIFAVSTGGIWSGQLSTGTITAVSINRSTKSIILTVNIPHSISPGSKTSARILGITYSAIGCKYVGCVTLFAKGDIGDSEFSQLLQLDAPVNNAVMTTSVSGDVSRYRNLFPYGAFLSHRNAVSMSATMVNNTMANFVCTDNDNDVPASVGMANIQIWDAI